MTVYELAQRYYPRLWSRERLEALEKAGRLSRAEVAKLAGEGAGNGK